MFELYNNEGLKTETFEAKIKEYAKKFENKEHKIAITLV